MEAEPMGQTMSQPSNPNVPADGAVPPIVNIETVLADPSLVDTNGPRGPFHATIGMIGKALGTRNIGINVTTVEPGKKAWPKHYHFANDELFIVLAGRGTLHYGETASPVREGDVVSIIAGTQIPFQFENTGSEPLRYLALSTLFHPDVFVYTDTGKVGVMAGGPPLREAAQGREKFVRFVPGDANVGYWDGEPGVE